MSFLSHQNIETIGRSQTICSYRMSEIRVHLEMSDKASNCLSDNNAMILRLQRKKSYSLSRDNRRLNSHTIVYLTTQSLK